MNRLKSIGEEWAKFALRGTLLIASVTLLFFWNSPHSIEDISLAIAIPLIISNCFPALLGWPFSYIRRPEPSVAPAKPFNSLPAKTRIILIAVLAFIGIVILSFIAGLSIWLATFAYRDLGITWAITPARHLSRELLLVSVGPVLVVASFVAGVYCSLRIRRSTLWDSFFYKTTKTLREWPKTA